MKPISTWTIATAMCAASPINAAAQSSTVLPSVPKSNPAQVDANKAALKAYIDAVNSKNQAAATAAFAPDATIEEPVGSPVRSGKAEAVFIKAATSGVVRYELVSPPRASGDSVAIVLKVHAGPVVINAIEVYTFDAMHRIKTMRAYFSPSDWETSSK